MTHDQRVLRGRRGLVSSLGLRGGRRPFTPGTASKAGSSGIPSGCSTCSRARGVKGTFFVLTWNAERHPELVRQIASMPGTKSPPMATVTASSTSSRPRRFEMISRGRRRSWKTSRESPCWVTGHPPFPSPRRLRGPSTSSSSVGCVTTRASSPCSDRLYGIPSARRFPFVIRAEGERELVEFPMSTARASIATCRWAAAPICGSSPTPTCAGASAASTARGSRPSSTCIPGSSTRTSLASRSGEAWHQHPLYQPQSDGGAAQLAAAGLRLRPGAAGARLGRRLAVHFTSVMEWLLSLYNEHRA